MDTTDRITTKSETAETATAATAINTTATAANESAAPVANTDAANRVTTQPDAAATTATNSAADALSQVAFDVDLSIYTQEALNYTCYDYAGRFYIEQTKALAPALPPASDPTSDPATVPITDGTAASTASNTGNAAIVHVTLLLKDATTSLSTAAAMQIRHEFNQSLLDYQTRIDLEQRFGHIRDLLVAEAFKPVNS